VDMFKLIPVDHTVSPCNFGHALRTAYSNGCGWLKSHC